MVFDSFKVVLIKGQPGHLFRILKDAERWPVWDTDLKVVKLSDKAAADINPEGAKGELTMTNGRSFAFAITSAKPSLVSYLTRLPGSDANWYWEFKPVNAGDEVELKMGVKFTGMGTFLYRLLMGPLLPPAFEKCTKNLKSLVEEGKVDGKEFPEFNA